MNIFFRILVLLVGIEGFALQQTRQCRLPDGVTDFEKIRTEEFCYVDKTSFILKMLESKLPFYFIACPRKFGKSLFCQTLETIFWGKKKLFEGLSIHDAPYDWKVYPVISSALHYSVLKVKIIGIMHRPL